MTRASLALMLAVGIVTAAVLATVAFVAAHALFREPALRSAAEPTILVAAATALLYWPSRVGLAALSGLERYDQVAIIQIASSLIVLAGLASLAADGESVAVLTAFFGVVTVLEGVVAGAMAWRPLGVSRRWTRGWRQRSGHLKEIAGFGAAAFVIGVADTLIYSLDRTIISAVVGAAAIVGYELGLRPHTAVRTIAGLSGLALVSPVARLATQERRQRLRELVLVSSFIGIIVTAPIAWLVIVLAHPFVRAWLGPSFDHYSVYVQIFTSYWMLTCCTTAASSALYGIGRLREYAVLAIAQAALALVLSVVLGIACGTVGVIWGTVIPAVISFPIFMFLALRLLNIGIGAFVASVAAPAYGLVVPWAGAVAVAAALLKPSGYPGLIAFTAAALCAFWVPAGRLLVSRWRRASRIADETVVGVA